MASNVPLSDTESSTGSSGVGENNNTINNPPPPPPSSPPRPHRRLPLLLPRPIGCYKCLDCYCTFPTKDALLKHQKEKRVFHSPPISCSMKRTILNMVRGNRPQPVMPSHPPPTSTIVLPQPQRANPITSRLAPLPSPFRHNNVAGNGTYGSGFLVHYHPYLRQETMPIGPVPHIGVIDHGAFSPPPEKKTVNLLSRLDPTQDFLSILDRQSSGQRGNSTDVVDVGGYGVCSPSGSGVNKTYLETLIPYPYNHADFDELSHVIPMRDGANVGGFGGGAGIYLEASVGSDKQSLVDPCVERLPRRRGSNKVTSNTGVDVTLKLSQLGRQCSGQRGNSTNVADVRGYGVGSPSRSRVNNTYAETPIPSPYNPVEFDERAQLIPVRDGSNVGGFGVGSAGYQEASVGSDEPQLADPYMEWRPRRRGTNKVTSNTGVDVTLKL